MAKWNVYGKVTGSQLIGTYEADSKEEAIAMAEEDACCSLCHRCSQQCEDAEVEVVSAELEES